MSMTVWERGEIVRKPNTFLKADAGSRTSRRLRDPLARSLSKRQINAALILAGIAEPDAFIENAAAAISDETQRALAVNDWRHAALFDRSHALFSDKAALQHMGKPSDEMDEIWLSAGKMPR